MTDQAPPVVAAMSEGVKEGWSWGVVTGDLTTVYDGCSTSSSNSNNSEFQLQVL